MNQYSNRRNRIANAMQGNSAIILFSGKAIMRSADETYPFHVDRNFYYLTGLQREGMVLLMSKIDGNYSEKLFILPYDELLAKWVGGRISQEEATQISEINTVLDSEDLDETVARLLNSTRKDFNFTMYFDLWHHEMDQHATLASDYANKLRNRYPSLNIKDVFPIITSMRLVKDEYEIECFKKAINLTNLGIMQMMKTCRPNINESVMEGVFDFVLRDGLCKENSFESICASGKRATVLHYHDNDQVMNDGELFLCDLGATNNHYCADISRTFPVNGKFSDRQKEIYEIVLQAQNILVENAKPGVSLKQLNQMVVDFYKEELPKHNLTKDVREYYYHSVSHHIGLDTHDPEDGVQPILQAGNIISNEPGLYIEDESIGIRIEDDLLITNDGCVNLSSQIIKKPEDIEAFMGQH